MMENNISELSKKFTRDKMITADVISLLMYDFTNESIFKLTEGLLEINTDDVLKFISDNKDLTDKLVNQALHPDVKLFLRIRTHIGTWYSDDYTPYCGQMLVKCSGPRMILTDYGHMCPKCKNEISFIGVRLIESPLNKNQFKSSDNNNNNIGTNEVGASIIEHGIVELNTPKLKMIEVYTINRIVFVDVVKKKDKIVGKYRDRTPDSGWSDVIKITIDVSEKNIRKKNINELTRKQFRILLEDLAFIYGNDSTKYKEKINEFKILELIFNNLNVVFKF